MIPQLIFNMFEKSDGFVKSDVASIYFVLAPLDIEISSAVLKTD